MKFNKSLVIILLLSWIPFFTVGHLKNGLGWFWGITYYSLCYFFIGIFISKKIRKNLLIEYLPVLPILSFSFALYIDDSKYYYPGIGPVFVVISLMSFLLGKYYSLINIRLSVILLLMIFSINTYWAYQFIPIYNYKSLINQEEYKGLFYKKISFDFENLDNDQLLNSKSLQGKIIILDFWYTGCKNCLKKMKDMEKLRQHYNNRSDIYFASVNVGSLNDKKQVIDFLSKNSISLPNLYDRDGKFSNLNNIGIDGYPVEIRLDKSGRVRQVFSGICSSQTYVNQSVKDINNLFD